jgi:hypothetical protein
MPKKIVRKKSKPTPKHRGNKKRNKNTPERQTTALAVIDKRAIQRSERMEIMSPPQGVLETMQSREKVRRFMSRCLNVDLQVALRKVEPGKELDKAVRSRLEIDWGTIPGVDKPFLMQPGAEKFAFWLGIRPKYQTTEHDLGNGHIEVVSRCVLYTKKGGEEVFEGPECSCSTMESNYRFRFLEVEWDEKNPKPSQEILDELKEKGQGRWRKKTEWAHGKKVGEKWVWFQKSDNPNIYDERNKVRQMAQKRALVKAIRNMGALSEIFTSDPSEWDIPFDDDDPKNDKDFTESGRRIVQKDGTMPSGRPAPAYQQPKNDKGNTPAQQDAADRTIEEKKKAMADRAPAPVRGEPANENAGSAKKLVTITWSQDAKVAKVEGEIAVLVDWMKGTLGATWSDQYTAWLVPAERVPDVKWGAEKQGLQVQEIKPTGQPRNAPVVSSKGVVKQVKPNEKTSRGAANVQVLLNGVWCYCYHKHLFEPLRGSLNQECEFVFEKASGPPKITGIKRIGDKTFEENQT